MMEEFYLAKRHKNFKQHLWNLVKEQPESLVLNKATKESKELYSLHRQVSGDYQRTRAFSRLNISEYGILYAKIEPEHRIEDLIAKWFFSRFPLFTIILSSKKGTFVISKDFFKHSSLSLEEELKQISKSKEIDPLLNDLTDFNTLSWENIYDSNFIKERKNKKYFQKNIPKKYLYKESLLLERKKFLKTKPLTDFINE